MNLIPEPDRGRVDQAKETLAACAKATADAKVRVAELASAEIRAEGAYDDDPTPANEERVFTAKRERELAAIRVEHAERREAAARAQLAAAEQALAVVEAEFEICQIKISLARTAHEAERAMAPDAALAAGEQLTAAVQTFKEASTETGRWAGALAAEHVKILRRLEAGLIRLIDLSPEPPSETVQELAETRATLARVETDRASATTFHARVAPYSTMIKLGASLLRDGIRGMSVTLGDMYERASLARAQGVKVDDVDAGHIAAAALLALRAACPDLITLPGVAFWITKRVLIPSYGLGDFNGVEKKLALASPLGSLLAVWGRALQAGALDDRGQPEELAAAKLAAALGANTERGAGRAVDDVHQAFWQAKRASEAEERALERHEASESGEALEARTMN